VEYQQKEEEWQSTQIYPFIIILTPSKFKKMLKTIDPSVKIRNLILEMINLITVSGNFFGKQLTIHSHITKSGEHVAKQTL
jgi:hypothetical protein